VSLAGAKGRENVGMSNRNPGERPGRRKPKVSLAMEISQGLGGPNRPPERVFEMDSRLIFRPSSTFSDGVTENSRLSVLLDWRCPYKGAW